jgi:hypothetical protein
MFYDGITVGIHHIFTFTAMAQLIMQDFTVKLLLNKIKEKFLSQG